MHVFGEIPIFSEKERNIRIFVFWKKKEYLFWSPVASQASDIPYTAIAASNQMNLCGVVELYEMASV